MTIEAITILAIAIQAITIWAITLEAIAKWGHSYICHNRAAAAAREESRRRVDDEMRVAAYIVIWPIRLWPI